MTTEEQKIIDGVVFSVVGELLPTSIVEGKVEGADYVAYVLWIPRTKSLTFKIWNKDGLIANPVKTSLERFHFKIEPYRGPGVDAKDCDKIYDISTSLSRSENDSMEPHKILYFGHPIYPAIRCIILDLIRLTNDGVYSSWN